MEEEDVGARRSALRLEVGPRVMVDLSVNFHQD